MRLQTCNNLTTGSSILETGELKEGKKLPLFFAKWPFIVSEKKILKATLVRFKNLFTFNFLCKSHVLKVKLSLHSRGTKDKSTFEIS